MIEAKSGLGASGLGDVIADDIEAVCLALVQRGVLDVDHVDDEGRLYFTCR